MTKSIISISAFGFADTVVIDGKVYTQDSNLPSVVIEDRSNKLYMYGQDALYERTGIGLSDHDRYSSRIPVALLWQQLKHLQLHDENKQKAANSLAKYIIQLACDTFDVHKRATANTAPAPVNDTEAISNLTSENPTSNLAMGSPATQDGSIDQALSEPKVSITATQKLMSATPDTPPAKSTRTNKAYLQTQCQLVICIPDNFDEAEQQALINAFSGFKVQLLWRSIATLLGHFNAHSNQAITPEPSFAAIMGTAKPATHLSIANISEESRVQVATSQEEQDNTLEGKDTATVHVLYIGPDSIDLSTYDLRLHTDQRYVIPIRRESVYKNCASSISLLHYAISYAFTFLGLELKESVHAAYNETQQQKDLQIFERLQNAVVAQVIYQFPEAWGQSDTNKQLRVLRIPQTQSQNHGIDKWCHVKELLPAQQRTQVRSNSFALKSFYKLYGCHNEQFTPYDTKMDMTEWIRKVLIDHHLDDLSLHEPHECLLITGPMLYGCASNIDSFIRMQAHPLSLRLASHTVTWSNMALGGCLFQERLNLNDSQTYPTYLDRLTKLSMVISNKERTDYKEQILINDDFIAPTQNITGAKVRLSINQGSDHVELYVSTDSNFNDASINRATETPFTLQSPPVSVQKATLTFASGRKAQENEPVIVWVEQRALSGYAKIHIKPDLDDGKVSSVLPSRGEVQAFDPSKKVDFTEKLPQLRRVYPPLSKPRGPLAATIPIHDQQGQQQTLVKDDIIFYSTRRYQELVYYDGKFGSQTMQQEVHDRLLLDHSMYYGLLLNAAHRGDFRAFCYYIDQCLPFPQAKPFGNPALEGIANTIALAVERAFYQGTTHLNRRKLIHRYCMFVPDSKEEVNKCCYWLLKMAPFRTMQLYDVLILIENHPQVFSPSSPDFSMGFEFARTLLDVSKNIIRATVRKSNLFNDIISRQSVIGSRSLSLSLKVMMYSLLYRKEELNFIDDQEIEAIEQMLDYALFTYQQLDLQVQSQLYSNTGGFISPVFKDRFHYFVEEKLNILLPEVKKYLRKEGSNPNIMSELQSLDDEGEG